jgi:hypothetical protein
MTDTDHTDATLFFCVGATKAGTSWLHNQLQGHPECHLKTIKELHYFGLTGPEQFAAALKAAEAHVVTASAKVRNKDAAKRAYAEARVRDLTDWCEVLRAGPGAHDRYLAYLRGGLGGRRLMGDMTPAYGLLPAETLSMMAQLTADVRFVYLMRDPVARLWSHVRMISARNGLDNFGPRSLRMLRNILNGQTSPEAEGILIRGDYCTILDKLYQALPAHQRLVLFYEDMFAADGLKPVCDFLSIAQIVPAVETKVHAGLPLDLPDNLMARARAMLQPQYDGVRQRLGALPAGWMV